MDTKDQAPSEFERELRMWMATIFGVATAHVLSVALDLRSLFFLTSSVSLAAVFLFASKRPLWIRLPFALIVSIAGAVLTESTKRFDSVFFPIHEAWLFVALLCVAAAIRLSRFDWDPNRPAFALWLLVLAVVLLPNPLGFPRPNRVSMALVSAQLVSLFVSGLMLVSGVLQLWRRRKK